MKVIEEESYEKGFRDALKIATNIAKPAYDLPSAPDAFDHNPPPWAKDSFNNDEACRCGYCDSWMTVVRPGKVQCDTCGDGHEQDYVIRYGIVKELREVMKSLEQGLSVISANKA